MYHNTYYNYTWLHSLLVVSAKCLHKWLLSHTPHKGVLFAQFSVISWKPETKISSPSKAGFSLQWFIVVGGPFKCWITNWYLLFFFVLQGLEESNSEEKKIPVPQASQSWRYLFSIMQLNNGNVATSVALKDWLLVQTQKFLKIYLVSLWH